jgi:hypothetical protein
LGLDGNKTKAGKYRGKLGALAEEDEDGEYFDEDDMSWPSDEEDEDYEEDDHRHQRGRQSHHISEDQFDQILQEYEDDDDYDDEDDDDNDDQDDDDEGEIDITADHDVAQGRRGQFEAALDEFIQVWFRVVISLVMKFGSLTNGYFGILGEKSRRNDGTIAKNYSFV